MKQRKTSLRLRLRMRTVLAVLGSILLLGAVLWGMTLFTAADDVVTKYASDMRDRITLEESGWEGHPPTYDKDLSGGSIGLAGGGSPVTYRKGIVAHASSRVDFNVKGLGVITFSSYVGIEDSQLSNAYGANASASFIVEADGVRLAKSPVFTIASDVYLFEVNIPLGTEKVSLITDAEGANTSDHTVWADAKFTFYSGDEDIMIDAAAELSSAYVSAEKPATISVTGITLNGNTLPAGQLNISYSSSDERVAKVSSDGKVTAGSRPGSAEITVTVKGEYAAKEIKLIVYHLNGDVSDEGFTLSSPDGKLQIGLSLENGQILYSVTKNGFLVVEPSLIGFEGVGLSLSNGFIYAGKSEVTEINETYKKYSGSYAIGEDHCNEQSFTFAKGAYEYTVVLRAYDDGFALRSEIASSTASSIILTDEKTAYKLPADSKIDAITIADSELSFYCYESNYSQFGIESTNNKNVMFPALVDYGNGIYALLTEAELYPEEGNFFYGSALRGIGNNTLELFPAPITSPSTAPQVTVETPFTSPWRLGVVGDLAAIVETDLVENLNVRTDEDYSWVDPGVTAWMWLSEGFNGQRNEATLRDYIDLAAEMNWKYLILDEGWQPNAPAGMGKRYDGYFDYFDDLIKYADSKGVGLIAWVLYADLDTPEEREILREWAALGIKGIKADFFDDERQNVISDMQEIYRICAEEHLLVNFHGANKPTGERSTYPHVINREAVNGQEFGAVSPANMVIWPYTRGVVGPTDITPTLYPTASTTYGHQLAISVVIESGMPCMASDSEIYREAEVQAYLRALPAKWDDLKFVAGDPFGYAVLARQSGKEWWVGGVTQATRNVTVNFDYLEAGKEYLALVFADGAGQRDILLSEKTVTSADTMTVKMATNGGFVIRLIPAEDVDTVETIIPGSEVYTVNSGETIRVSATVQPSSAVHAEVSFEIEDPTIASISQNGTVTGLAAGVTNIIMKSADGKVTATAELRVVRPLGCGKNDAWLLLNGADDAPAKFFNDNLNRTELTILQGDVWNSPQVLVTDAPSGDFEITVKLSGGLKNDFQSAGLAVYAGYGQMVLMERRHHSSFGGNVFCISTHNGTAYTEYSAKETNSAADAYLKLEKKGNVFTGYYSYNGSTWTKITQTITSAAVGSAKDLKVGIVTRSGNINARMQVNFDDFKLNGKLIPFSVNVTERTLCKLYPAKDILIEKNGVLPLPASVQGYLSDGTMEDIPVTWDTANLDLSKNGTTIVTGRVAAGSPYSGSTLTASVKVTVGTPSPYDLTGDGILTIEDATALLRYIAAPAEVTLVHSGDLTGDSVINIKDVTKLLWLLENL